MLVLHRARYIYIYIVLILSASPPTPSHRFFPADAIGALGCFIYTTHNITSRSLSSNHGRPARACILCCVMSGDYSMDCSSPQPYRSSRNWFSSWSANTPSDRKYSPIPDTIRAYTVGFVKARNGIAQVRFYNRI